MLLLVTYFDLTSTRLNDCELSAEQREKSGGEEKIRVNSLAELVDGARFKDFPLSKFLVFVGI